MKTKTKLLFFIGGVFVFLLTAGAGLKYTENPAFCASCHVMNDVYSSWRHSAHREVTNCNSCHAPHGLVQKVAYKTLAGSKHVFMNTFADIPINFKATDSTDKIIQANCVRCHQDLIHNIENSEGKYCFQCHRYTPHGK